MQNKKILKPTKINKNHFFITLCAFFAFSNASAQQWTGSTNDVGLISRKGQVQIGEINQTNAGSLKLNTYGSYATWQGGWAKASFLTFNFQNGNTFSIGSDGTTTNGRSTIYFGRSSSSQPALDLNFDARRVAIGTIVPKAELDINGSLLVRGYDIALGAYNTETNPRSVGNSANGRDSQRALVHGWEDDLLINFNCDFENGVKIGAGVNSSGNTETFNLY